MLKFLIEKFLGSKKMIILLFLAAVLVCFTPNIFGSRMAINARAAGSIKLNQTKMTVSVGASSSIKVKNAGSKSVEWSVKDKRIATIKKKGTKCVIKGVKAGTTTVKAKVGGKTYKCAVTVSEVLLNPTYSALVVGEKGTLKIDYWGNSSVKWSISKSSVAKITPKGNQCTVKAKKAGTATIKAKVDGKTYKAKIKVRSTPYLCVSKLSLDYNADKNVAIFSHCYNMEVKVKSNDTSVVKVREIQYNKKGECVVCLSGVGTGSTNIVAKAGGKSFKIKVKVSYTEEYKTYNSWRKKLEKKLWKSSMSDLEKIEAVGEYITENFLYDYWYSEATCYSQGKGGDCKAFSQLMYDVAADLGLKAKYNGVTSSIIPGHRYTTVTIKSVEYRVDASTNPYTMVNTFFIEKV